MPGLGGASGAIRPSGAPYQGRCSPTSPSATNPSGIPGAMPHRAHVKSSS